VGTVAHAGDRVLVVPTSRMIWASFNSGWLRTSHRIALGRSWRRDTGDSAGPFLGLRRQRHLALAELEAVVGILLALLDLVAGELAGRNRSMPLMPWAASPSAMARTSSGASW